MASYTMGIHQPIQFGDLPTNILEILSTEPHTPPQSQPPESKSPPLSPQLRWALNSKPPRSPLHHLLRKVFPQLTTTPKATTSGSYVAVPSNVCRDSMLPYQASYISRDPLLPKMFQSRILHPTFEAADVNQEEDRVKKNKSTGTTTIAMKYKNGIVMAADGRVTADNGFVLTDVKMKLVFVQERAYICVCGDRDVAGKFVREIREFISKNPQESTPAGYVGKCAYDTMKGDVNYRKKDSYGKNIQVLTSEISANQVCQISSVYKQWSKYYKKEGNVVCMGSGGKEAQNFLALKGITEKEYKPECFLEQCPCEKLVFEAMKHAEEKDWGTGGTITLITIQEGDEKIKVQNWVPRVVPPKEGEEFHRVEYDPVPTASPYYPCFDPQINY